MNHTFQVHDRTMFGLIDDDRHSTLQSDFTSLIVSRSITELPFGFPFFIPDIIKAIVFHRNQNFLGNDLLIHIGFDLDRENHFSYTIRIQIFVFGYIQPIRLSLVVDIDCVLIDIDLFRIGLKIVS